MAMIYAFNGLTKEEIDHGIEIRGITIILDDGH